MESLTQEQILEQVVKRDKTDLNQQRRMSMGNSLQKTDEGLLDVSDEKLRLSLAADENTPIAVLTKLASDSSDRVRRCVARNRSTPQRVLTCLATDPVKEVRLGVAWNPRCPFEILKAFSKQPNELLTVMERPAWLTEIINGNVPESFPLKDILHDSLYYAGSGLDGTPIKYLVGNVYSFVYADLLVSKEEYLRDLKEKPPIGYEMVYEREVFNSDIATSQDVPLPFEITEEESINLENCQRGCVPFGHWSVWKHMESDLAFSLFFLRGEICAVYQGLYVQNKEVPRYLAIIQPGHGDGVLGWEDIRRDNCHFRQLVMGNPAGVPEFMISGMVGIWMKEYLQESFWSDYGGEYVAHLPERCATVYPLKRQP